jgi:hypothetical protein
MTRAERNAQIATILKWEHIVHVPHVKHGAKLLNISWFTYNRYRKALRPLPVVVQYAMHAIVYGLAPWDSNMI